MTKPVLDSFDRLLITTDNYLGRSVKRKLTWLRFRKRVLTIIEKI